MFLVFVATFQTTLIISLLLVVSIDLHKEMKSNKKKLIKFFSTDVGFTLNCCCSYFFITKNLIILRHLKNVQRFFLQIGNLIKKIYTNIQSRGVVDGKVYIIMFLKIWKLWIMFYNLYKKNLNKKMCSNDQSQIYQYIKRRWHHTKKSLNNFIYERKSNTHHTRVHTHSYTFV